MSKNKKIVWGIVGIIVLVAVFFGGVSYGKGQTSASVSAASSAYGARGRGAGGFGGGMTVGQIIAKDATSITVQLMTAGNGTAATLAGSKIVFVDSNTKISKQVDGTLSDLAIGANVSVTGTVDANTGSITAASVQIRPAIAKPTQ